MAHYKEGQSESPFFWDELMAGLFNTSFHNCLHYTISITITFAQSAPLVSKQMQYAICLSQLLVFLSSLCR